MRAKFYCQSVEAQEHVEGQFKVDLSAVISDENMENQDFNRWTPAGELSMYIDNPRAEGFFEIGKEYYLDFTKSE